MNKNIYCQKLPDRYYQKCPMCGEMQPIMMMGVVAHLDNGELMPTGDRGYSFCNCRNIFYTKWENIDTRLYDELYNFKYQCEDSKKLSMTETEKFSVVFKKFSPNAKTFIEIGSIHDHVLDNMNSHGYDVSGIDIINRQSIYPFETCNFEEYVPHRKYDIVWASHIFEHFKDPKAQLIKCKNMLNDGGLLYIAMPDTFFIDFEHKDVLHWDWIVNEHHILWGMDSFIEFAEELGLKCVVRERNHELNQRSNGQWFWKRDFKVVLTHA